MQFKQSHQALKGRIKIVLFLLHLIPLAAISQTTYLPQDARENILIERLEIKAKTDSILNFSKTRPFSRRQFTPAVEKYFSGVSLMNDSSQMPPSEPTGV